MGPMKELAGRLTALDPDAGAAVRVIAYFDRLAESRAGLEALVRGAAVLAGCPARLADPERHVHVRVETDGTRRDTGTPPDPAWPAVRLSPGGTAMLWLERGGDGAGPAGVASGPGALARGGGGNARHGGPAATVLDPRPAQAAAPGQERTQHTPSVVDAVILERAAGAVRLVLDRTRGRAPAHDPALVETLLDATAPEPARLHAARRLGLDPTAPASPRGTEGTDRARANVSGDRPALPGPPLPAGRLGVGPAVPVLELPRSWAEARTALRFTAEGTPRDPGPRVVYADELGGVALLADLVPPGSEPPADARSLEAAAATAPWLPVTLHAITSTSSLRAAAAEINVHHSTLQERLAHAEHLLGWPIRTPQGRLRLHLALTMRRLARP